MVWSNHLLLKKNKENGYEFVDLGLSVKWATYNVGASKPEEYGDYFAWGETETYYEYYDLDGLKTYWKDGKSDGYKWSSYKFRISGDSWDNVIFSKYNNTNIDFGTVDNKTTLDPEDDVAHVKWGGSWRMPTIEEQVELLNNCTWTWYAQYNTEFGGVAGYKVTSNITGYTNCSIFLPAAGYHYSCFFYNDSSSGGYFSSSLGSRDNPWVARCLRFSQDGHGSNEFSRCEGLPVRPVCP